jgi:hypothetical protein
MDNFAIMLRGKEYEVIKHNHDISLCNLACHPDNTIIIGNTTSFEAAMAILRLFEVKEFYNFKHDDNDGYGLRMEPKKEKVR